MTPARSFFAIIALSLLVTGFGLASRLFSQGSEPLSPAASTAPEPDASPRLLPLPAAEPAPAPELALLMGTLQRLTHKLALSADAGNAPLAAFYLHESLEQLRAIQAQSPEYENQPIAVLIDRLALPAYADLQKSLDYPNTPPPPASRHVLLRGLDRVIASCNECHAATQHAVIQITRGTEVNPFNQSFRPLPPPAP